MAQTISPLKRFKTHMAVLKKYTSRVIQDRRDCPEGSTTAVDILGLFLKAAAEEESKFDHQYLTDVVLNLILAGRDTTVHPHLALPLCSHSDGSYCIIAHFDVIRDRAFPDDALQACLLSWTFYELCLNPDVMETLRRELKVAITLLELPLHLLVRWWFCYYPILPSTVQAQPLCLP